MSHMIDEIFEQPKALQRTFESERAHAFEFKKFARRRNFRLIILVARGTSDNAALFGRYLLELTTGIPVSLCAPSVYTLYRAELDLRQALAVGISQSGESTDVNMVLQSARRQGAFTLGITNEPRSTMGDVVEEVFHARAGRQRSVAATKTYTCQLLLLYLVASALGSSIRLSSVSEIPDRVKEALRLAKELRELVQRYRYMRHCVVVGRGLNYANAFELSLKLMETCYVVAERFSSADFLHGPIAMIESDLPVFLFMPPGKSFRNLRRLAERLRRMNAETLLISSTGVRLPPATRTIRVAGSIPETYTAIPYIVPGQLFAAMLAEIKGLNPDKPRFLRMVTRTV
jgi:glucosamine--fructose-6-phosphate aminotransferase (isomerizing)